MIMAKKEVDAWGSLLYLKYKDTQVCLLLSLAFIIIKIKLSIGGFLITISKSHAMCRVRQGYANHDKLQRYLPR